MLDSTFPLVMLYAIHVHNNEKLSTGWKDFWTGLLLFASPVSMLVYGWIHLRPGRRTYRVVGPPSEAAR